MKPGMDICWLFSGRLETSEKTIKDMLKKKCWKYKQFWLVVDHKAMQRYYWRRLRGLANSRTVEKLFLCWLPPCPSTCRSSVGMWTQDLPFTWRS